VSGHESEAFDIIAPQHMEELRRTGTPDSLVELIGIACNPIHMDRFQSAAEMLKALEQAAQGENPVEPGGPDTTSADDYTTWG
jgi:hypothetical protein